LQKIFIIYLTERTKLLGFINNSNFLFVLNNTNALFREECFPSVAFTTGEKFS